MKGRGRMIAAGTTAGILEKQEREGGRKRGGCESSNEILAVLHYSALLYSSLPLAPMGHSGESLVP